MALKRNIPIALPLYENMSRLLKRQSRITGPENKEGITRLQTSPVRLAFHSAMVSQSFNLIFYYIRGRRWRDEKKDGCTLTKMKAPNIPTQEKMVQIEQWRHDCQIDAVSLYKMSGRLAASLTHIVKDTTHGTCKHFGHCLFSVFLFLRGRIMFTRSIFPPRETLFLK